MSEPSNEHALDVIERGEPYDLDMGCAVLINNEHRTDLASSDTIWVELRMALAHIRDLRSSLASTNSALTAAREENERLRGLVEEACGELDDTGGAFAEIAAERIRAKARPHDRG